MEEDALPISIFGTSLSLTTSLRSSIQSELQTLDAQLSALSKSISAESSIRRSINKEMERASREMAELRRGGGDVVESETVMADIHRGWREGEMKEIRSIVTAYSVVEPDEGEEGTRYIPGKMKELRAKQTNIESIRKELEGAKSSVGRYKEEEARIAAESDRLSPQNGRVVCELEKRKMEYEGESRRCGRVKEALARSRQNSGVHARAIADKAQEQITQRSSNLSKESAIQTELDSKNQELIRLAAEEKKVDAELSMLSGLLDSFIQQHVESEGEISRGVDIKDELERVQAEIEELVKLKESKVKIQDDEAKSLEEAKKEYEAAAAGANELEVLKNENDKAVVEVMQPAVAEKTELCKEKEKLVGETSELHNEMAKLQGELNEAAAGMDAKTKVKTEEFNKCKNQFEKAQSYLEEFLKSAAADEESNNKDLQEINDFKANLEAATQGEITRLDTMKRQKTDERLAKLDQRRTLLASLEDVKREEIDYLKDALKMVHEIENVKTAIKDREIELTEDGEELLPAVDRHKEVLSDLKNRSEDMSESNVDDREDMETQASPSVKRRV